MEGWAEIEAGGEEPHGSRKFVSSIASPAEKTRRKGFRPGEKATSRKDFDAA
jgi:hypothetical protein